MSDFNFEFRLITEFDLVFNTKGNDGVQSVPTAIHLLSGVTVHLLDAMSDQEGLNPLLVFQLSQPTFRLHSFGSRMGIAVQVCSRESRPLSE